MRGVAVLGSGAIARAHAAGLARLGDVRVTHVVGSDLARAASLTALAPGAVATTDLDAVLNDRDVDGVVVCGSTADRARLTIAAAQAGKHALIEKPAALTLADFDAMVSAAERAGTRLMVGQTVRFQPVIAELHRAIASGSIGRPRLLHVSWFAAYSWPGGWRAAQLDRARSGGHAIHNGPHALDLGVWLTGRTPVRVFARSFTSNGAGSPVPESMLMTVRFDDGSLGQFDFSYSLARPGAAVRRIMVAGETGTLVHDTESEPGLDAIGERAPESASTAGAMDAELRHWVDTLDGADQLVRTDEVRTTLATAIAAQRSLDEGRPVEVES